MATAISLYDAPTAMVMEKFIVRNAMAQAMMNAPGVMDQGRNNAYLAVVEAGKNVGLALDPAKSVVQVVTEPAMICGTTNVRGAGVLVIRTVRHVPEGDMMSVPIVMVQGIKIVHGVGGAVIRIVITVMVPELKNVNAAPGMENCVQNVPNVLAKVRYLYKL